MGYMEGEDRGQYRETDRSWVRCGTGVRRRAMRERMGEIWQWKGEINIMVAELLVGMGK